MGRKFAVGFPPILPSVLPNLISISIWADCLGELVGNLPQTRFKQQVTSGQSRGFTGNPPKSPLEPRENSFPTSNVHRRNGGTMQAKFHESFIQIAINLGRKLVRNSWKPLVNSRLMAQGLKGIAQLGT